MAEVSNNQNRHNAMQTQGHSLNKSLPEIRKNGHKSRPVILRMEKVCKYYGSHTVLDDVTLNIRKGDIFALLGGSGAGKSTLLKILAGFEQPSSGRVYLDDEDITSLPPFKRPINMMFQSYALFPHMTVEKNIAFGLKQDKLPAKEIKSRVEELLGLVHMEKYAKRKPHQLSGGQQQRVALARSLAKRPKILLLDEPMGALDKQLRSKMRLEVVDIIEKVGVTCLMVTHDQEEAMTMADHIGIMHHGCVIQQGTPIDIYEAPNSLITARFIGSVNIFEGNITSQAADHVVIESNPLPTKIYIGHGITAALESTKVWIAVRPEKIELTKEKPIAEYNWAQGIVDDIAYLGAHSVYHVKLPNGMIVLCNVANTARSAERPTWEDPVYIHWEPNVNMVLNS